GREEEIARQVADERQLGRHREIGAERSGLTERVENQGSVAGEVADGRVHLQQRNLHGTKDTVRLRPRPYHTMERLVILAPNWLGDAVMALPAIADVRRAAAGARIAVAARPAIAPLFALVPDVDETIVLERRASIGRVGSWRALGAELADRGFDTALLLPHSIQ